MVKSLSEVLSDSAMKLRDKRALKTSSVKRVQNLISLLAFTMLRRTMSRDVQTPTQAYMGRKGTENASVRRNSDPMKARERPVGARNAIGCPLRRE